MHSLNSDLLKDRFAKYSNYLIVFVAILLMVSLYRSISKIRLADEKIEETRGKVEKLERENQELESDLVFAESEEYLEKQLRDGLGYAKLEEIIVVLPDEELLRKLAPKLEQEEVELPKANWEKWAGLFEVQL